MTENPPPTRLRHSLSVISTTVTLPFSTTHDLGMAHLHRTGARARGTTMIRQRGLAAIAVYALLALGGLVALAGWWEYHNYTVRAAERAKWTEKLKACENATATAVEANRTLQASADALVAKIRDQNERIAALQQAEAAARQAKQDALAAALAKERALRTEINRLTVIAAGPPAPSKEVACAEAESLLRSLAAGSVQ